MKTRQVIKIGIDISMTVLLFILMPLCRATVA